MIIGNGLIANAFSPLYLTKPRKYMQTLLKANDRPHADLHSFRHTFNQSLTELGMDIEDRSKLLAHASSATTKIYTHPNFDLAIQYVNRVPQFGEECNQLKMTKRKTKKPSIKRA